MILNELIMKAKESLKFYITLIIIIIVIIIIIIIIIITIMIMISLFYEDDILSIHLSNIWLSFYNIITHCNNKDMYTHYIQHLGKEVFKITLEIA